MIIYVVTHFFYRSPHNKEKKSKKYCQKKSKKIYYNNKRTWGCPENSQRLVMEVQKIQRLKFDNIFFTDKGLIEKKI